MPQTSNPAKSLSPTQSSQYCQSGSWGTERIRRTEDSGVGGVCRKQTAYMATLPINSVPAGNDLLVPSPTLASRRRGFELSPIGGYDSTRAVFHVAPYVFRHLPEHFKVTTWPEAQPSLQWKGTVHGQPASCCFQSRAHTHQPGAWGVGGGGKPGFPAPVAFAPYFSLSPRGALSELGN